MPGRLTLLVQERFSLKYSKSALAISSRLRTMPLMKIALGADHAGFELKGTIKQHLQKRDIETVDEGTNSAESVDYPDFARRVGQVVSRREADLGILVCGSGIGMAIAANKVEGIRAANVSSEYEARMSREHNDANVLALGARILNPEQAIAIVESWLNTQFAGGRHERRVEKIAQIEREARARVAAER
jgi:ribose 5-phosphate isomerase B